jgi:hypothetical protein
MLCHGVGNTLATAAKAGVDHLPEDEVIRLPEKALRPPGIAGTAIRVRK